MYGAASASTTTFQNCARRLARWTRWAGPFAPMVQMLIIGLPVLSLSRLALVIWQWERVSATNIPVSIFVQGVRADLILLGYFLVLPLLLAPLLAYRRFARPWKIVTVSWTAAALVLVVFMELSSPQFIAQYDVRPNRLFVEYLSYPKEVFATLWNGFRLALLVGISLTLIFSLAVFLPERVNEFETPGGIVSV